MDITIKIDHGIEQKARQKANGEGFFSLHGWISHLFTKEVDTQSKANTRRPLGYIGYTLNEP